MDNENSLIIKVLKHPHIRGNTGVHDTALFSSSSLHDLKPFPTHFRDRLEAVSEPSDNIEDRRNDPPKQYDPDFRLLANLLNGVSGPPLPMPAKSGQGLSADAGFFYIDGLPKTSFTKDENPRISMMKDED